MCGRDCFVEPAFRFGAVFNAAEGAVFGLDSAMLTCLRSE